MKCLRICSLPRRDHLNKEGAELMLLLRFVNSSELIIINAYDLAVFDNDVPSVVLLHHVGLVV